MPFAWSYLEACKLVEVVEEEEEEELRLVGRRVEVAKVLKN